MLKNLCDMNAQLKAQGGKEGDFHKVKIGDQTLEIGDIYTDDLLSQYVQLEISNLANFLSGSRKISLDLVIKTMYETGKDLSHLYRETAEGGLAKHYGAKK
jgi:hypothetical protein